MRWWQRGQRGQQTWWSSAAALAVLGSWGCSEGTRAPDSLYNMQPSATPGDTRPPSATPSQGPDLTGVVPLGPPLLGLHAVGNRIQTADGETVRLRGVNRSGTEYKCIQNGGIFDGPSSLASVQAIASWNVNAVRVPLNEDCWLGINGVSPAYGGEYYRQAIVDYVRLLHAFNIAPILDLHWTAPAAYSANRLQPLPNVDHSLDFWRAVADTFKDDDGVVFEPFNEPFPDGNRDTDTAWQCWRDGCMANLAQARLANGMRPPTVTYAAAGMQSLVDAIRETGAQNLILLGGVQYSNALTQWLNYVPSDPLNNLAAAWHIYDNNACRSSDCWNGVPTQVAATYPVVVTELGQGDCSDTFIRPLLAWLDTQELGYLAWAWNAYGPCQPRSGMVAGQPWSLVTDYTSGAPNGPYAQAYHDHLMSSSDGPR
jgi:endoglucanase